MPYDEHHFPVPGMRFNTVHSLGAALKDVTSQACLCTQMFATSNLTYTLQHHGHVQWRDRLPIIFKWVKEGGTHVHLVDGALLSQSVKVDD